MSRRKPSCTYPAYNYTSAADVSYAGALAVFLNGTLDLVLLGVAGFEVAAPLTGVRTVRFLRIDERLGGIMVFPLFSLASVSDTWL